MGMGDQPIIIMYPPNGGYNRCENQRKQAFTAPNGEVFDYNLPLSDGMDSYGMDLSCNQPTIASPVYTQPQYGQAPAFGTLTRHPQAYNNQSLNPSLNCSRDSIQGFGDSNLFDNTDIKYSLLNRTYNSTQVPTQINNQSAFGRDTSNHATTAPANGNLEELIQRLEKGEITKDDFVKNVAQDKKKAQLAQLLGEAEQKLRNNEISPEEFANNVAEIRAALNSGKTNTTEGTIQGTSKQEETQELTTQEKSLVQFLENKDNKTFTLENFKQDDKRSGVLTATQPVEELGATQTVKIYADGTRVEITEDKKQEGLWAGFKRFCNQKNDSSAFTAVITSPDGSQKTIKNNSSEDFYNGLYKEIGIIKGENNQNTVDVITQKHIPQTNPVNKAPTSFEEAIEAEKVNELNEQKKLQQQTETDSQTKKEIADLNSPESLDKRKSSIIKCY